MPTIHVRAWKRKDGRYRLEFPENHLLAFDHPEHGSDMTHLGGTWDAEHRQWAVPESVLGRFTPPIEKVYGVVTGPSSCGCEPAMFRWVGAAEVEAGFVRERFCPLCDSDPRRQGHFNELVIIDVCGEADVAREVYEAEFADKLRSIA